MGSSALAATRRLAPQIPVFTMPGSMRLTLTPTSLISRASASAKPSRANLVAQYALRAGAPIRPAIESITTMRPCPALRR